MDNTTSAANDKSQNPGTNKDDKSYITGTSVAAKDAGHDNFPAYLSSYGFRLHNDDDEQMGRGILQGMGYGVWCNAENAPAIERNEGNSQNGNQGGK
jgi:hypothetical protein